MATDNYRDFEPATAQIRIHSLRYTLSDTLGYGLSDTLGYGLWDTLRYG